MQSSLKKHQLIPRLNQEELTDYARNAYHRKQLVLVDLKKLTDPYIKQAIINYADEEYGKP
jgi:hypothetical protein